jgi:hypothetical protein
MNRLLKRYHYSFQSLRYQNQQLRLPFQFGFDDV